ncbi:MAG: Uma2 family endonuclease [Clostridium sp.]|nr:Uma2 family endonuclease [Clostridium sp.]MBO6150685.1 Uma2 family endonuclease [Clostridium sp.]
MTLQEMKERKQELGYSNEQLAERSGLPLSTVQKVMGGITKSPRRSTIEALEKVLSPERSRVSAPDQFVRASVPGPRYTAGHRKQSEIREPSASYGAAKDDRRTYTIQDLYALPEGVRAELIDGKIYYMSSPVLVHQLILFHFHKAVWEYIQKNEGSCIPVSAPMDVQLDEDDLTLVQPDFLVVCDKKKVVDGRIFGAPDFVMEVLSPTTRQKDLTLKTWKYNSAGVREYWIIDPDKQQVLVYNFEDDCFPHVYGFDSDIPVSIYNGDLTIDMAVLKGEINFLMR